MSQASRHEPAFIQHAQADAPSARDELAAGLREHPATIAPKYFYDALGSRLFDAITELPEYYLTRTESELMSQHAQAIARACVPGRTLVDLGAGNCEKAARLFPTLTPPYYVAVDIAVEHLRPSLTRLQHDHPTLPMLGLGIDFSRTLALPAEVGEGPRTLLYPGSSIGNFSPAQALEFLRQAHAAAHGGTLLIGVDLVKPVGLLEAAYDDALGLTAAFNLNLLRHVNRLLGSDFNVRQWSHLARFDSARSCIEMHLKAQEDLTVRWLGGERHFAAGESLHTEDSTKYHPDDFAALLRDAGFRGLQRWVDERGWFAVFAAQS